jgi:hypothetical protein
MCFVSNLYLFETAAPKLEKTKRILNFECFDIKLTSLDFRAEIPSEPSDTSPL